MAERHDRRGPENVTGRRRFIGVAGALVGAAAVPRVATAQAGSAPSWASLTGSLPAFRALYLAEIGRLAERLRAAGALRSNTEEDFARVEAGEIGVDDIPASKLGRACAEHFGLGETDGSDDRGMAHLILACSPSVAVFDGVGYEHPALHAADVAAEDLLEVARARGWCPGEPET